MSAEAKTRTCLRRKIVKQIKADLTVGRKDNGLPAFSKEEIANFMKENEENITKVITDMLVEYEEGDEQYNDYICEYLYTHVKSQTWPDE